MAVPMFVATLFAPRPLGVLEIERNSLEFSSLISNISVYSAPAQRDLPIGQDRKHVIIDTSIIRRKTSAFVCPVGFPFYV